MLYMPTHLRNANELRRVITELVPATTTGQDTMMVKDGSLPLLSSD
jgi:hypothetical protein